MRRRRLRRRLLDPLVQFIQTEASSGILLMSAALVAILWANSTWAKSYFDLWHVDVTFVALTMSLLHWINDGLMAVFFLVVGLEIKRELLLGELSSAKRAALPIAAALGGMIVPALIYAGFNTGGPGAKGWGIPMATDIAFALGVLALLGPRIPLGLKVFLAALAIVDDLGAVLVIAIFYTAELNIPLLLGAGGVVAGLLLLNKAGIRQLTPYVIGGIVLWFLVLQSGIHATIAGVLLAATIPTKVRLNAREYASRNRELVDAFEREDTSEDDVLLSPSRQTLIEEVARASEDAQMPLERLEGALHPWVTYGIVPTFALANAGVPLGEGMPQVATHPIALGVMLGLVVGKPIGIALFAYLAVKRKLAELPQGVRWRHVIGVGMLGGIGFTMSLFVADLGLATPQQLVVAKSAILLASAVAGIAGFMTLRRVARR